MSCIRGYQELHKRFPRDALKVNKSYIIGYQELH